MAIHNRAHTAAYAAAALLAFDGSLARCLAEKQSLPEIVAAAPTYDFGTTKQGQTIVHAFTLRNRGARPHVIERVDLSQAGMNARFARRIEPGQERTITVSWDTRALSGEVSAEAVVRFQDSTVPALTLVLNGVVRAPIELLPHPAVFFSVYEGETAERRIRIVNNEESPVAVTGVEVHGGHFLADVKPVQPGRTYELVVRVPTGVPPGRYMEAAYLLTDHPERPRLAVSVNVLVKTDLYANPEAVDFGTVNLTELDRTPRLIELLTQPVILRRRQGPFEIKSVESSVPAVKVLREPAQGSSESFRLDVSLVRSKLRPGPLEGSIRILTTVKEFPEVVVKVSGTAR